MKYLAQLIFILITSSGCYSQKLKTFVHPTDGFEIGIPKGWNMSKNDELNLLVFATKNRIKDGIIYVKIQDAADVPMNVLYNDYIRALRVEETVVELGEEIINERNYKIYLKVNLSGAFPTKTLEYFTMKENKMFTVSFTTYESTFKKLEPLFRKVSSTIKY